MSLAVQRYPVVVSSRGVREAREEDLPRIVEMCRKIFPAKRSGDRRHLSAHLADVFFRHPWRDEGLTSLVFETGSGNVTGVLGILPRRMWMNGKPVVAAVTHTFMVEPERRSGAGAIALLKALFSGPQDLILAEGNDASRRLWRAVGGDTSVVHSIRWSHLVRPARFLASRLGARRLLPASRLLLDPLCTVADLVAVRLRDRARGPRVRRPDLPREIDLTPDSHLACLERFDRRYSLRPRYQASELSWLIASLRRRADSQELRGKLLLTGDEPIGWYLYYARRGGVCEVIQLGAAPSCEGPVLDHLFCDARNQGAVAVAGQLELDWMQTLSERRCLFHHSLDGSWCLVHSRDPEIRLAIHRGDCFLSRLEGEWWIAA